MTQQFDSPLPSLSSPDARHQIDHPDAVDTVALVIDLDGTLINTDMLYESYFASALRGIKHHWAVLNALRRGKASLKNFLANVGAIDYSLLPFNKRVIALAREARERGQKVFLATASDQQHAAAIAAHLDLFDGVFSSDGKVNLTGAAKARRLVETFGEGRFDYVGNSDVDLAIWAHARTAYVVGNSTPLLRKVEALGIPFQHLAGQQSSLRIWLKALRVHQYAKNVLVFVPLLTAHAYAPAFVLKATLAFVAFSLCASAAYFLNDLFDLNADRQHPTKRQRPFASGAIPLAHGVIAVPLLFSASLICAIATSPIFTGVLLTYFAVTLAYSVTLKRRLMVDVVVLAMLYTIRVIAGAVALPVVASEWLLVFCIFIFTCLALVKRYVELAMRIDRDLPDPTNRNYRLFDLPIVGALAAASGFNAVTIFALYVSSPAVKDIYHRPDLLWLICPILIYWLSRMVILAHRRVIDDDPIVFALRDRNSRICAVCMIAIVLVAS